MPGFIDIPATTALTINRGTQAIAGAQGTLSTAIAVPSTTVAKSISTTVTGVSNGISQATAVVNGAGGAIKKAETALVGAAVGVATSYLANAIKSISGTFGGGKTDLATGISGTLNGIFKNTNIKTAAGVPTLISDPVSTNLLNKPAAANPNSTTFKVDSLQSGSQAVTSSGTSSTVGTGASLMKGITQSTLLDRFNIDSITNLTSTITNSFSSAKINGLITNLEGGITKSSGAAIGSSQLGQIIAGLTPTGIGSTLGLPAASSTTVGLSGTTTLTQGITGSVPLSTANDLALFTGNATALGKASGLSTDQLSGYYLSDPNISLVTDTGTPVNTNGSGVDATLANSILGVLKIAGCAVTNNSYSSSNILSSLFNLGLGQSAQKGMMAEVNSLLGCSHSSTALGQQSLVNAFIGSAGSQIAPAHAILGGISSPSVLNTNYVSKTILTNPTLNASSVGMVGGMFTTMGTSMTDALSVPGYTDNLYPVHDAATLSTAQPSFINAIYGDTSITDCFGGSEMGVFPDGSLNFI